LHKIYSVSAVIYGRAQVNENRKENIIMVKKINSSEFEQVRNSKAAIVDFSAEWCGPCKMLAPVIDELSEEIDGVEFYNIDVDENPELAREFRIMNIPAVIALKEGEVAGQQIGFVPKEDMKNFIDGAF